MENVYTVAAAGVGRGLLRRGEPMPMSCAEILTRSSGIVMALADKYTGATVDVLVAQDEPELWDEVVTIRETLASVEDTKTGVRQWIPLNRPTTIRKSEPVQAIDMCRELDELLGGDDGLVARAIEGAVRPGDAPGQQYPVTVIVQLDNK